MSISIHIQFQRRVRKSYNVSGLCRERPVAYTLMCVRGDWLRGLTHTVMEGEICHKHCLRAGQPGGLQCKPESRGPSRVRGWMSQLKKRELTLPLSSCLVWALSELDDVQPCQSLIQMIIFSRNSLTDTLRNNVLPALWVPLSSGKLTHKITQSH